MARRLEARPVASSHPRSSADRVAVRRTRTGAGEVQRYVAPMSAVVGALFFSQPLERSSANGRPQDLLVFSCCLPWGIVPPRYDSNDYSYKDPCKLQQQIYTTIVEEGKEFAPSGSHVFANRHLVRHQ